MAAGRPTKYHKIKTINATREYLDNYEKMGKQIPSIVGLALFLKVNSDTIHEWRKKHPEFSDMVNEILNQQQEDLLKNGLSGKFNPTIAKLVLCKHGYGEQQQSNGNETASIIAQLISKLPS